MVVDVKVTEQSYMRFLDLALTAFSMNLLRWGESKKRKTDGHERLKNIDDVEIMTHYSWKI